MTTGSLLVALYVLSDFGAVSILRYEVFTQAIFLSYNGSFDRTPAAILGGVLIAITGLIVTAEAWTRRRFAAVPSARTVRRPQPPVALRHWQTPALVFALALVVASIAQPLVTLSRWSLRAHGDVPWSEVLRAAQSTLTAGILAAGATTALAFPLGILAARWRTRSVRFLEGTSYLGHSLPGVVIALSVVFFGVRYARPIYQRLPLLILAYVVLFLPLAVGSVRSSVEQSPPVLDDVARALGVRPVEVVRRVIAPLAIPGIAAGAALTLLAAVKELPATILLRPTGMETLATRLWTETSVADYGRAAPYALGIVAIATVPTLLLQRWSQRHGS